MKFAGSFCTDFKLVDLKKFIEKTLLESKVIIPNLITRTDNGKASSTVIKLNEHIHRFLMETIGNGNISSNKVNKGGLHLIPRGLGKFTINFIGKIKKIATTWHVTGFFNMLDFLTLKQIWHKSTELNLLLSDPKNDTLN